MALPITHRRDAYRSYRRAGFSEKQAKKIAAYAVEPDNLWYGNAFTSTFPFSFYHIPRYKKTGKNSFWELRKAYWSAVKKRDYRTMGHMEHAFYDAYYHRLFAFLDRIGQGPYLRLVRRQKVSFSEFLFLLVWLPLHVFFADLLGLSADRNYLQTEQYKRAKKAYALLKKK